MTNWTGNMDKSQKKRIILIGGSPTTGKTTLARRLSEEFKLPWISTDTIREMMGDTVDRLKYPNLFAVKDYSAKEFLTQFSAKEIVERENKESEDVWLGVKSLIEKDYAWDSFIVEGIAILPHLVARDFKDSEYIRSIFLVDEDESRIRDVIFKRGLWDEPHLYDNDLKEKEIAWVKEYSTWLRLEAQKYGYPCVEVTKQEGDLKIILDQIGI
jgi:2-phosphoglycerate kinase